MKDLSKPFKIAVATAIGSISVPVFDSKRWVASTDTQFVILGTQTQTPSAEYATDCTWAQICTIDIEVYDKSGSEVTKNNIDDISNEIAEILVPAPFVTNITSANLQFTTATLDFQSRDLSLSETESILSKIIRFSCIVIEQS